MRLHYAGKYNLDPESLPSHEPVPGAVQFREAQDTSQLAKIATVISIVILVITLAIVGLRGWPYFGEDPAAFFFGAVLCLVFALPHELIHAMLFKEDAYIYTNLRQGMLFVIGPEDMSKQRFIIMSLMPAIVLGFIPLSAFVVWPHLLTLGCFGAFSLSTAAGDFYNVFNALTQMPAGSRTYLHGFNSYWYMPEPSVGQ